MSDKNIMVPGTPDASWREIVERLTDELTDDIPEKVVRATELLLSGYPTEKAAKEIGVSSSTIKSWIRKYPTVAHVLAEGRQYLQIWRMAQLEQQFLKAVTKSEEILDIKFTDHDINQKVVATVAQHARFVIGLFAGQKIDINITGTASDPILKAKADALDYIAQKLAERKASDDPITVSYHVIDAEDDKKRLLLNQDGSPLYGDLGKLDTNEDGSLCHICGNREKILGIHIAKDHDLRVRDYEAVFLLENGAVSAADGGDE